MHLKNPNVIQGKQLFILRALLDQFFDLIIVICVLRGSCFCPRGINRVWVWPKQVNLRVECTNPERFVARRAWSCQDHVSASQFSPPPLSPAVGPGLKRFRTTNNSGNLRALAECIEMQPSPAVQLTFACPLSYSVSSVCAHKYAPRRHHVHCERDIYIRRRGREIFSHTQRTRGRIYIINNARAARASGAETAARANMQPAAIMNPHSRSLARGAISARHHFCDLPSPLLSKLISPQFIL